MTSRTVWLFCYASTLACVVYIAATGDRWPLALAATMLALGVVIGAGEALLGGDDGDR